jgi:hypothetical protein
MASGAREFIKKILDSLKPPKSEDVTQVEARRMDSA